MKRKGKAKIVDFSEKRREWLEAKGALKNLEIQREKREQLEENIEQLKKGRDNKELLYASIKKLRELDHEIDRLEEYTEERAKDLQAEIIKAFLAEHPEEKTRYLQWQQELHVANSLVKEGQEMGEILKALLTAIQKMLQARQTIKKRGILSYVFGKNPNVLITQAILETQHFILKKLPEVEKIAASTCGGDLLREVYAEVIVFLSELEAQCKDRWNFKKIDTLFTKAEKKTEMFLSAFEGLEVEQKTTVDDLRETIDRWLID